MFMRYRGGGIGHLYMREVQQRLDSSRWGSYWPNSLRDRDPSPDQEPPPQDGSNAAATSAQNGGYKSDCTEGDLGEDSDDVGSDRELTDEDGEGDDPEHSGQDSDEDTEEEEERVTSWSQSRRLTGRVLRARRAMQDSEEDEIEPEGDFDGGAEDIEEEEDIR